MNQNKPFCIVLSVLMLFGVMLTTNSAQAAVKSDTLTIIHLTDTHICNLAGYNPVYIQKRQHYGSGVEPLRKFFKTIPFQTNADLIALTGDNIDYYQAETATGNMMATQIEQYTRILNDCPITVATILGNHDIADYWVDSDSTYASYQINSHQARAAWIRNIPCFHNGTYYNRDYQVGETSYRLIFLDNAYYARFLNNNLHSGKPVVSFVIDKMQLTWLNYQLQQRSDDVEIIFMHIAIRVKGTAKKESASQSITENMIEANGLLQLLNEYPSIRLIVAGHTHDNKIRTLNFPENHHIPQLETGAFGRSPQNWRSIKLTDDKILISNPGNAGIQRSIELD